MFIKIPIPGSTVKNEEARRVPTANSVGSDSCGRVEQLLLYICKFVMTRETERLKNNEKFAVNYQSRQRAKCIGGWGLKISTKQKWGIEPKIFGKGSNVESASKFWKHSRSCRQEWHVQITRKKERNSEIVDDANDRGRWRDTGFTWL